MYHRSLVAPPPPSEPEGVGVKRILAWLRDGWLIAGMTLLMVLLVDALLREALAPTLWPLVRDGAQMPDRRTAPAYEGVAWAADYWSEHAAARAMGWQPYAYWRREPFEGRAIRVDGDGLRRTLPAGSGRPVIWVLGGSSVWGTGVDDGNTLPSWLARLLAAAGVHGTVLNLGESGYVSGQSLAYLQYRLREEPPPDVLVFVEGANDVFAALQAGRPGLPQNEGNRARDFRVTDGIEHYLLAFPRVLEGLRSLGAEAAAAPDELAALARGVVATYRENRRQARALVADAATGVIHAWQPTVFGREDPPPFEADVLAASYRAHYDLQRACDELVRGLRDERQLILTDLYDGDTTPIFVDALHPGPEGQRRLAERLLPAVLGALEARRTPPVGRADGS